MKWDWSFVCSRRCFGGVKGIWKSLEVFVSEGFKLVCYLSRVSVRVWSFSTGI